MSRIDNFLDNMTWQRWLALAGLLLAFWIGVLLGGRWVVNGGLDVPEACMMRACEGGEG